MYFDFLGYFCLPENENVNKSFPIYSIGFGTTRFKRRTFHLQNVHECVPFNPLAVLKGRDNQFLWR